MSRLSRALGLLVAVFAAGCDDVPSLTFESNYASLSDGDSLADGPPLDAGCPGQVPSGAAMCCGAVACNGNCDAQCDACATTCGSAFVCCAHANNVVCRSPGAPCN